MGTRLVAAVAMGLAVVVGVGPCPAWSQTKPRVIDQTTNQATNGIRSSNGIRSGGTGPGDQKPPADAPRPLIVPAPDALSWRDVLGLNYLHYAVLPRGKSNVLFAWGGVETGASVRFRAALDAAKPIDEIWLYSQGGDLDEGLEIGRLIHARKLATHVVAGQRCVSACNFMFMGGLIRYVDRGAQFTVHMFSDDEVNGLKKDLIQPPKTLQQLVRRYRTVDFNRLVNLMNEAYPGLGVSSRTFQAARSAVKQASAVDVDDEDAMDFAALKRIIADYNRDHPDEMVDEKALILQVVLDEDVKSIQMSSAQTAASIARFLTEMGLSLKFLTRFAEIHNDTATPLTREELREFNVMNTD